MSRVAKKNGRGDKILENWSCWNSNSKYLLHNTNSNLMQHVQDIKVTSLPYEKNCLECKILTINSNLVTIVVEIHHNMEKQQNLQVSTQDTKHEQVETISTK